MPTPTGIIDAIATPPLVAMQQVLDIGGPYAGGDHTLTNFTTSGGFVLPAGTYAIAGTYGVIVQASTFPLVAGRILGWNDPSFPTISGDAYLDRIAQVCLLYNLPTTGATIIKETFDVHLPSQLFLWPGLIGGPSGIGLHVFPNFEVELFFMCIL
jgi:hypothetical protein